MVLAVQHAAKAEDAYFLGVLYDTLVAARETAQLLQLDSPLLERHLRTAGGLPDRGALLSTAPIGPLSPTQVAPHRTPLHEPQTGHAW